jgi:hypothetical protein
MDGLRSRDRADAKDRPEAATGPDGSACDIAACRSQYRSFDEATCTYRAYRGERRQCTK